MAYAITLIPGDGIGPEVTAATVEILDAVCPGITWEPVVAGEGAMPQYGKPLPDHVLDSIKKTRVGLKGPIGTPVGKGFTSVNVGLRKALDLYVSLRPVDSLPGLILLRREGTGGETPFTLRLDLVDEDGMPAGKPHRGLVTGVFPAGPRFFALMGKFDFEFPRPGSYRLDITVDEEFAGNVFSYNIDLWLRQGT